MRKLLTLTLLTISLGGISCSADAQNRGKGTEKGTTEEKQVMVKIETNKGTMTVKLYNETPKHRDNFIKLVKEGYYDSLLFHRVIKDFMIQGGDPDSRHAEAGKMLGNGGPDYTIPAEFDTRLYHKKGALAAARLSDQVNPSKASSGSQFYIVQGKAYTDEQMDMISRQTGLQFTAQQRNVYRTIGGTPFLDMNYTVFGEVVEGLSVIDKIAAVQTGRFDRPTEDVVILSMTVIEQ